MSDEQSPSAAEAIVGWIRSLGESGDDAVVFPDGSHVLVKQSASAGINVQSDGWVRISQDSKPTVWVPAHDVSAVVKANIPMDPFAG